ncbi:MAG: Rho termination factor N-terminal domain-containing protein [Proteobacteria bacterium]|nr:SAP domain-containing protein [Desulfocapsa sp.]MBU3946266.1 Rho termination factor N-terminal domain-containing protein [Pseudomonadota bacterium]MCG2742478.1 Rho termination factor N-terminal domain-containing protein [Desulfobacteraceae bacterium]MBU3984265.1 Rho termination factor N-terminal domain-containing protein [Pseudomonadota bacterium]MBU4044421.1 Rho termination factor N-terminal domain-containing protein [Pseudomonadota bacterium]
MKIQEIKKMATAMGIKAGKMKKSELIWAIQSKEGNSPCFQQDSSGSCLQMDCCWRDDCMSLR